MKPEASPVTSGFSLVSKYLKMIVGDIVSL